MQAYEQQRPLTARTFQATAPLDISFQVTARGEQLCTGTLPGDRPRSVYDGVVCSAQQRRPQCPRASVPADKAHRTTARAVQTRVARIGGRGARTIHQGRVESAQAAESMRRHLSRGSRGITRDVWGLPRPRALLDYVRRRNGCTLKEFATAPNRGWARFREYLRERRRSSRTVFHETTR